MPQDSRRNCYQESSYHPHRFQEADKLDSQFLINDNGLRRDDRNQTDPRAIFMEVGIVTRAKGSSYIEVGKTKVICACYGPRQLQSKDSSFSKGVLMCEMKFASFATDIHKTDQSNLQEQEMSAMLVDALSPCVLLDRFPKAQVDIYITVLEDDGSAFASSITAASLALADAGIEMFTLAIGANLKQFGDLTLLDPTAEEEAMVADLGVDAGQMTLAYMYDLSQVSMITQQGHSDDQKIKQGMLALIEMCKEVYPLMQRCLFASIKKKT
ncbi:exosome complex component MTR3-like isoform X2 [Watersipora subatra]|uniref:exosome complex component MTR3-like isoform X2 n=1 Tax=Watersipora subatra TaxID=2589382 RepID=UPI00355B4047